MTLIAHSNSFVVPFVAGDILLSSTVKPSSFVPPTRHEDILGYLNEPYRRYFPCDLAQKVYIINPQLVVGVAGSESEIKPFVRELKQRSGFYGGNMIENDVKTFLDGYDLGLHCQQSAFFMQLVEHGEEGGISLKQFTWGNWDEVETQLYAIVNAVGSGAKLFNTWSNEPVDFSSTHEPSEINYPIQSNTILFAKLLAIERATLRTLHDNWGCGFELAFYNIDGYEKISNITYLLFESEFRGDGGIGEPTLAKLMHYSYSGGRLTIYSIDILHARYERDEKETRIHADKVVLGIYPVQSFLDDNANEEPSKQDISFTTYTVATAFTIIKDKEKLYIPGFSNNGIETKVEFVSNKICSVTILNEYLENIKNEAKKIFPNL